MAKESRKIPAIPVMSHIHDWVYCYLPGTRKAVKECTRCKVIRNA